ncbi:hypothetical protein BU24DRAFT_284007 [Aaosphaeria arxii CBS 175.79]|uniref:Uncharacterized protein n=1 Tax=Aaosphaeria arxii CBS 175.79 TaxID=1450172 RepID=A0A6A5XF56_9PLEO|nr:uncharacterized protein BU24DRAFT_284007 [Aaosphaeria arxii CBS 175.79]KAF2011560.1 hypothetical protein BU24DRAFT_284007 [Aaosphaeria arxii CBS 175.79]
MAAAQELPNRKHPRDAIAEEQTDRSTRTKLSSPVDNITPDESAELRDNDSETSSILSESSSDPSSESSDESSSDGESTLSDEEDEEGIVNLRANRGKKPRMKLRKQDLGSDIRPFLKDFLPKLKAANEELEAERLAGTLKYREIDAHLNGASDGTDKPEEEEGEGQYVEMNLGLGVLEEQNPNASDDSSSDEGESHGEMDSTVEEKEKDFMGKLMGQERHAAGIQIVDDAQET